MSLNTPRSVPAFNVTRAVGTIVAINLAIHVVRMIAGDPLSFYLVSRLGFAPSMFLGGAGPAGNWLLNAPLTLLSPVGYAFLHSDWIHIAINMLFLLAFGTPVERRIGQRRFLIFYCVIAAASCLGTMIYYLATTHATLVIGASGAVSGLFGAAMRFGLRWRGAPGGSGRLPPAVPLVIVFVVLNLLTGLVGFSVYGERGIAWEAHLAGLLFGYLLFPLFDPTPKPGRRG